MKRYIVFLAIIANIFIFLPAYSQNTETITITTYYPAPFGIYEELRSKRMAIGETYFDASVHPWDADGILAGGEINQNADLVVEDNVGIGLTNPLYQLDVVGDNIRSAASGTQYVLRETDNPLDPNDQWHISYNDGNLGFYWEDRNNPFDGITPGTYYRHLLINSSTGDMSVGNNVTPQAKLDVAGGVKIADDTDNCTSDKAGTMRYHGGVIQYCNSVGSWEQVGPSIACDFEGIWIYWDDKSDGNDFGVVCRSGKVERWCNYPAGAQRGLHPNVYVCNCSGCL